MIGQIEASYAPAVVTVQPTAKKPVTQAPEEGQLGPLEVRIAAELEEAERQRRYRNQVAGTCLGLCVTLPIGATVGITTGMVVSPFLGAASTTIIYFTGAVATCGTIISSNNRKDPL